MASYSQVFSEKEETNWLETWLALQITKEGLADYVDSKIQKVHADVGRCCGNCSSKNLIPCPTDPCCTRKKRNYCPFRISQQFQQCPTYDNAKQNITSMQRYCGPSGQNTKPERWEIQRKCYLPRDGFSGVYSIQESDFHGLISVMLNCAKFEQCLSSRSSFKPPDPQCLLVKVRQIGREILHTADCKVTDADLHEFFQTLTTLLSDSVRLTHDLAAKIACTYFYILQNDQLSATHTELLDYRHFVEEISSVSEIADYGTELQDFCRPLKLHYNNTFGYVPVDPLSERLRKNNKNCNCIYFVPKIYRIETEKESSKYKTAQLKKQIRLAIATDEYKGLNLTSSISPECKELKGNILFDECIKLENIKRLILECRCDNLSLSSCPNLEYIDLKGHITLLPNALHGLKKLKCVSIECKCDGLDLATCNSLEEITLQGQVSLSSNGIHDIQKLNSIVLNCTCECLNLSTCHNLKYIALEGNISLLPNALRGLNVLQRLELDSIPSDLDLSSCHSLEYIELKESTTVLQEAINGLPVNALKSFILKGYCPSLDLSMFFCLTYVELEGDISLLPNALHELKMLTRLVLDCQCVGLNLSSCTGLEHIEIKGHIKLLPIKFSAFKKLECLVLDCKCDGLDLSECHNLKQVHLKGQITLTPNALRDLKTLTRLKLDCMCNGLS